MSQYWKVTEDGEDVIELPSEEDGSLLLTTLAAQFPGASGLKYKIEESGTFRGIRLADGKLHSPDGGFESYLFHVVFPKGNKRKTDELEDSPRSKKIDTKFKCSDLIILGLPYKTSEDQVREYFESYGELLLVQVKKNPQTGRSKGFGFIRFADIESQAKVICTRHLIDGRWCEVKIAGAKNDDMSQMTTKIFVGRLTEDISVTDLNDYFSKFGQVLDVYIPQPFRGFAFVNFADPFVAYQLCGEDHIIKQVSVHVSKASPRGESNSGGGSSGSGNSRSRAQEYAATYLGNKPPNHTQYSQNMTYPNGTTYSAPQPQPYRSSNNESGVQVEYRSGVAGKSNNSGNSELSNLGLTPALLAAAINQAGLGSLLNQLNDNNSQRNNTQSYNNDWDSPPPSSSNWNKKDKREFY